MSDQAWARAKHPTGFAAPGFIGAVKKFLQIGLGLYPIRSHIHDRRGSVHDSRTIANCFLALARQAGDSLTPMQLLKLVYIAHGWMLGLYGRPLIRDEVQAWQYGPVIPRLYNAVRDYRGAPVTEDLRAPNGDLDEYESDVVHQVYGIYGKKSGPALSRLTHAPGTPWELTYVPGQFGITIPADIIEDHYQRLAAK